MSSLSSQPYKGTRDYYPEDKRLQNYIFTKWRNVAESFGYEEYGAPILEPLDIYTAKSGQELANEQTYTFTDRGGRIVAVRPEMTPSVSRMVAARRQELPYPARLYSIANFMRYERPQRGREREFWQFNVDIFGVDDIVAEAEIIAMADAVLKSFGAKDEDFVIKINNRKLINFMMAQYLGLDAVSAQLMVKLFDRKDKVSRDDFTYQAREILAEDADAGIEKINALLSARSMADLPVEIRNSSAVVEVQELFTFLERAGVKSAIFDITLMRGLDYYTGTVFEVFDTRPENTRAMFGGGRYDGLVGLFGAEPISAVGMAPGGTVLENFLQVHQLIPDFSSNTDVYVISLGDVKRQALKLARDLREAGVNVELDVSDRKLDRQIKTAARKKIPYMLFIGEQEVQSEIYPLKNVITASEEKLSFAQIVDTLKSHRSKVK
jgi:histidyl-tRNA synthetase